MDRGGGVRWGNAPKTVQQLLDSPLRDDGPCSIAAPRPQSIRAVSPVRPILGFGRAGWLALAVLVAMIAALALGWDPYMQMLRGWVRGSSGTSR